LGNLRCLGLVINEETKNVEPVWLPEKIKAILNIKTISVDDSTPEGRGPGATV
jgi:hypothetical protein